MERLITKVAESFVVEWCNQIASRGVEYQCMILSKILKHPMWKGVMLHYN
jgi:hypothetical protein